MEQSTYYDLNLVEGTDIVNPLIIDRPNYERIDEVMHENAIKGIPTATELLSGTVHAITRSDADAAMFRFTATANWLSGDTVTVDGIQVTALLPTGQALATGAYVINSNVLCCLVGTVLTIYTVGGAGVAEDSEKLGGELPEFYATASELSNVRVTANGAAQSSAANATAIANLTPNTYSATLGIGSTQITFSNIAGLSANSRLDLYQQIQGEGQMIAPTGINVGSTSVSYTFDAQEETVNFVLEVR